MSLNKYIVMMRFGDSKSFNLDKGFVSKDDATKYVEIMKRSSQDKFVKYFLFEQSVDFQDKETKKPNLSVVDKIRNHM